jgi:hypothetical protein
MQYFILVRHTGLLLSKCLPRADSLPLLQSFPMLPHTSTIPNAPSHFDHSQCSLTLRPFPMFPHTSNDQFAVLQRPQLLLATVGSLLAPWPLSTAAPTDRIGIANWPKQVLVHKQKVEWFTRLAKPKSVSFTWPAAVSKMFSGFRSRNLRQDGSPDKANCSTRHPHTPKGQTCEWSSWNHFPVLLVGE